MRCCIADCRKPAVEPYASLADEGICADHLKMAGKSAFQALTNAKKCVEALERRFANQAVFDRAWKRGRYLQFCGLIESAHHRCDSAWAALKHDIVVSVARTPPD